ncbi:MAG: hypothetical protein ACD_46C00157G0002 [uncultured bacterium]|nr:MAG: hypothetical protein ACD_46C00157G0002 [uncultured bacterium]
MKKIAQEITFKQISDVFGGKKLVCGACYGCSTENPSSCGPYLGHLDYEDCKATAMYGDIHGNTYAYFSCKNKYWIYTNVPQDNTVY